MKAPLPSNEQQRIAKLLSYEILDSIAETAYDDLTSLAAYICETPIALISLVDSDRQWFKSKVGMSATETHRDFAFCAHALLAQDLFIIPDALQDQRFVDNPLVTGAPYIRFYAGAPLITPDDFTLGTLCVIDYQPRQFSDRQKDTLRALSRQIVAQLELGQNLKTLVQAVSDRQQAEAEVRQLNIELEARVQQRTHDLQQTNASLRGEIQQRQHAQAQLQAQTTALEQTLDRLQQTQSQLIHTDKIASLGQLVAGVAHEINNPLGFIAGNLHYACDYAQNLLHLVETYQRVYPTSHPAIDQVVEDIALGYLVEDLPKLFMSMQVGTDRIRETVDLLRRFSRMDEFTPQPADVQVGLENTLLLLRHRLKPKPPRPDIQIIRDYASLPPVTCCIGQLNQVFMNLLANAIDTIEASATAQPSITIRTTMLASDRIRITIADNGGGIDAIVLQHIFEPFFTTKPIGKGTGLGLSISYQIIDNHQGHLTCESTLGKGTEFAIELLLDPTSALTGRR